LVGRRCWTGVLAAALLGFAGRAAEAAEVEGLELQATPEGPALLIEFSSAVVPAISSVRDGDGRYQRIYVDLPARTTLAPGVPRRLAGAPPLSSVRVGMGEGGRLRIVVDLARAPAVAVEGAAGGRRVTLVATTAPRSPPAAKPASAAPKVAPVPAARPEPSQPKPVARAKRRRPTPVAKAEPLDPKPVAPAVVGRRPPRIVLDPGHGGDDPGALGYAVEKHVTLAIARELGALLEEGIGADVRLTRNADTTLSLAERTQLANEARADLFVSIHANASARGNLRGIETYYLDNTNDRATLRLVAMENGTTRAPPPEGHTDLRYILSSLVQGNKQDTSARLAATLQTNLVEHMSARHDEVVNLGVKRGPFYVLVGAYMPCVLVETSFLNHRVEGRRLADARYRSELARGLYAGIVRFWRDGQGARTL
jgi:N-acetylmuramoyl-L-alanine amidase